MSEILDSDLNRVEMPIKEIWDPDFYRVEITLDEISSYLSLQPTTEPLKRSVIDLCFFPLQKHWWIFYMLMGLLTQSISMKVR